MEGAGPELSGDVIIGALCGIRTDLVGRFLETDITVMPSGPAHLSSQIECFHDGGRSQRKVTLEKTPRQLFSLPAQ